jgi:hypothetical protein
MNDRRTIRTALAAFNGNIYQKHYVPELSYTPPLKEYIKACMLDFCVRKSIISRRILTLARESGAQGYRLMKKTVCNFTASGMSKTSKTPAVYVFK